MRNALQSSPLHKLLTSLAMLVASAAAVVFALRAGTARADGGGRYQYFEVVSVDPSTRTPSFSETIFDTTTGMAWYLNTGDTAWQPGLPFSPNQKPAAKPAQAPTHVPPPKR